MWVTKAIIFCLENSAICFTKQDCWFSQEMEVYKGHTLLEKIGDGQDILNAFDGDESKDVNVESTVVKIGK